MNSTITEAFHDEVYTMLGDSMVDVELGERDISVAFNRAKRKYKQYADNNYKKAFYCVPVNKDCQEYIVPKSINTIVKVIRPKATSLYDNIDGFVPNGFNRFFYHGSSGASNRADFVTLEFAGQHLENWGRYLAHDVDFDHNQRMGFVRFLNKPKGDQVWMLECYLDMEDEEYMEVSWVVDWTLAEAKNILGRAYRKLSGVPSPDGSTAQLGGNELIQEAEQDMQRLIEDIQNGLSGDTSWWGVSVG